MKQKSHILLSARRNISHVERNIFVPAKHQTARANHRQRRLTESTFRNKKQLVKWLWNGKDAIIKQGKFAKACNLRLVTRGLIGLLFSKRFQKILLESKTVEHNCSARSGWEISVGNGTSQKKILVPFLENNLWYQAISAESCLQLACVAGVKRGRGRGKGKGEFGNARAREGARKGILLPPPSRPQFPFLSNACHSA